MTTRSRLTCFFLITAFHLHLVGAVDAEPRSVLDVARSFEDGGGYLWGKAVRAARALSSSTATRW
jgi:hypothetical protein